MARPADRAGRRADGVRTERWDEMQRRLARKAGQVATFEDTPRLLKAAEEPEAWEELLQTWPEALGPASRLRPTTGSSWVETKDVPSLEEELLPWIRDALGADFVRENFHQLAVRDRGPLASRDPAPCLKRRPSGAKTPPRLQLEGPKTLRESLEKFMASLQGGQDQRLVDLLGVERQPRTVARQHYDLNKDPRVAVDEFVLATRKAERRLNARKLAAWGASELVLDRGSSPDRARAMRSAGRVSSQSDEPEQMSPRGRRATARSDRLGAAEAGQDQMRSHLLERLDYLHTCRGSMGESLYAQQRHRLEMQAHLRAAEKYSLEEKPPEVRCAYSAQVRGGKSTAKELSKVSHVFRPATAPELVQSARGSGSKVPPLELPGRSKEVSALTERGGEAEAVARTFRFARQCAAQKLPMPNLKNFTLGAATPLTVPNWSLGDEPLLALASSPLRENVARVEEGNFRGNRLSNKGVEALVSSLGSHLTTLNLSANGFDGQGVESILSFIRRAPKLTDVNLSGNKLSDNSVSRLCLQLSQHCPRLQRLSLSDVQIGWDLDTGAALGSLVTTLRMKSLDVSFNTLHGQGAVEFLKSLPSSRLRCLDMSWNCLGKGELTRQVAEELSQVFQRSESLQHLDISYNSFQSQELEILSRGLATNRTLWGLHIDGSGAYMDADGFLIPPAEFYIEQPRMPRAKKKSKATKKPKAPKKETEQEISVAGTLLSPQELEARVGALQAQMELQDLIQEYHQRKEQEEKEQVEVARQDTIVASRMLQDFSDTRMPLSLPELIRRLTPGERMSPRSQDEMLHSLALEVRPELPASLRETAGTNHGSFLYLEPSKENFLYKHSNCWICGDWVEVVFEATVADLPQLGDDVTCSALVSIDNFSQPVPLTPSRHGLWRGSRFLPPTERLLVIFRVGEELCTHPKLPVRTLQRPLQVPNRGDGSVCGEVNVLQVADLAEAFCLGVPPEGAAHVCGSAALCGGALHGPRLTSSTKAVS